MGNISKVQNKFISQILILFLSMHWQTNFYPLVAMVIWMNIATISRKIFDWIEFNRQYVAENCSDEVIIGFDPSYITKSGSLLTELVISILAAVVNTKEGLRLVTSQLLM